MAIDNNQRCVICALHREGFSPASIAAREACNLRTVQRIIKHYSATGESERRRGSAGRPRRTTIAQDEALQAASQRAPELTALALKEITNVTANTRTVQRRLREGGRKPRRERLKEAALNYASVREKRSAWCQQHREEAGWADRTVFVDGAVFCSSAGHRRLQWVSASDSQPIRYVRRSGRVSIAVFGGIYRDTSLPLVILPGSLTCELYKLILEKYYIPFLQAIFPNDDFKYVQDNCPAHKGKAMMRWLDTREDFKSKIVFQPPYSNDLNPIECVWGQMKRWLNVRVFVAKQELIQAILEAWERIRTERRVPALLESMPRRIAAVIEAGGGATKY